MKNSLTALFLFAVIAIAFLTGRSAAQGEPLEVGVRSYVPDTTYLWSKNKNKIKGDGGHGKVYAIAKVSLIKAPERLVKPVDEKFIADVLLRVLDANGFHEFVPGQKPDILITASYGRGEMINPYIRDTGERGGGEVSGLPSASSRPAQQLDGQTAERATFGPTVTQGTPTVDSAPPGSTITGADSNQLFDEFGNGYQEKLQRAAFEKIFIRVTAWEYPTGPKAKPKMLWKTVMVVDDPDHRDLNDVAAAMLEAGGPHFDKTHREPEVLVRTTLPDGKVNVGTPEVVKPFPTGK